MGVTHAVVGEAWSLSEVSPYQPLNVFLSIVESPTIIILPEGWEYKFHCSNKSFVSIYMVLPCDDDTTGFLIERQITFGIDMVIQFKIFNKVINLSSLGISVPALPSVDNINGLINYLNEFHVCVGGPLLNQSIRFPNNNLTLCANGHWRHKNCEFLIHFTNIQRIRCIHCMSL